MEIQQTMSEINDEELKHLYDEIDAEIAKNGPTTDEELMVEIEGLNRADRGSVAGVLYANSKKNNQVFDLDHRRLDVRRSPAQRAGA
jgi:hypothetical protein